jgi:hypothetical protein
MLRNKPKKTLGENCNVEGGWSIKYTIYYIQNKIHVSTRPFLQSYKIRGGKI